MAYKMVGYFENWAQWRGEGWDFKPDQIDPNLYTHINYAFANFGFISPGFPEKGGPKLTGDYKVLPHEWNDEDILYPALQKLKEKNPNLKTLISIGGWNFNDPTSQYSGQWTSELFSRMAASGEHRKEFIESAIEFAQKHDFDGIDIDWEYPGDARQGGNIDGADDFGNFLTLLAEFRQAIGEKNLLLTIAAPAIVTTGVPSNSPYKDPKKYFEWLGNCSVYLDWLNIMAYDYHGAFDPQTGVLAPLLEDSVPDGNYSVKNSVESYLKLANIPPEKLVLGIGTYGRTFKVAESLTDSDNGPNKDKSAPGDAGGATKEPGVLAYYEIAQRLSNNELTRVWHEPTHTPYAYSSATGEWMSYEDEESLAYKTSYLIGEGVGGAMVWAIALDDFKNGFPLQKKVKETLDNPEQRAILQKLTTETSGYQPSVALNDRGVAVQLFHKGSGDDGLIESTLHYRIGNIDGDKITWGEESESYDLGNLVSVAINDNGVVVEVHCSVLENDLTLWYRVGQVNGNQIEWGESHDYENKGFTPDIAINNDGVVVAVHGSDNFVDGDLWYKVGQINGNQIEWGQSHKHDTGVKTSVAINDYGVVVEVHDSFLGLPLWYKVGQINGNRIEWGKSHDYENEGFAPDVAINNEGLIVEVHNVSNSLYRRIGLVKEQEREIEWMPNSTVKLPSGTEPSVDCNRNFGLLSYQPERNKMRDGLFTLPDYTNRLMWISVRGDNAYCYYALDSIGTREKKIEELQKTIKVDAGAPYLYALLIKDYDSGNFPNGVILRIEAPDNTVYNRESNEEKLFVKMSGASLQSIVVEDPLPGNWLITLTIPEDVEFHFEFATVPSRKVISTIKNSFEDASRAIDRFNQKWNGKTSKLITQGENQPQKLIVDPSTLILSAPSFFSTFISKVTIEQFVTYVVVPLLAFIGSSYKIKKVFLPSDQGSSSLIQETENTVDLTEEITEKRIELFGQEKYDRIKKLLRRIADTFNSNPRRTQYLHYITVATWNVGTVFIMNDLEDQNNNPPDMTDLNDKRIKMLLFAEYGAAIGIDIIAFQEAPRNLTDDQFNAILGATGYSYSYMNREYPENSGRPNQNNVQRAYLILYNPKFITPTNNTLDFLAPDTFVAPITGYQCRPPVFFRANVNIREQLAPNVERTLNGTLSFFNWHNEVAPADLPGAMVYEFSELLTNNPQNWRIIGGDFNYADLDEVQNRGPIFEGWNAISGNPPIKDHILSNAGQVLEVNIPPTFESDSGHIALIADISFLTPNV